MRGNADEPSRGAHGGESLYFTIYTVCVLLIAISLTSACSVLPLAPVQSSPPVSARQRPADDYDDRVMDALAGILGQPDLPSCERLIVVASPKVELILLVAGLASNWSFFPQNASVGLPRKSAEDQVRDLRQHDAVRQMTRFKKTGFWYDALPNLALMFSDPPAMEQIYPIPGELWRRSWAGEGDLRDFMTRLRAFAAAADWKGWWQAHLEIYAAVEARCQSFFESCDLLGQLEDYFGEHLDALVVVPSAMLPGGGFGGSVVDPMGKWAICCFGWTTWGSLQTTRYLDHIVLHEAGHTFVNHHATEHPTLVKQYEHLHAAIADYMKAQAYSTWEIVLNEHILRASNARIYLRMHGEEAAEFMLEADERQGFRYVRPLYEKLAEYEANRERYPDFGSFYEELLSALKGL